MLPILAMAETCSWSTVSDGEDDDDDKSTTSSLAISEYESYEVDEVKSLKTICLDSVKENFDRFIEAHSKSSNPVLQRNLLFLQRKYTDELLSHFHKEGIDPQYIGFLLNENLKTVNLMDFRKCSGEDVLAQIKKIGDKVITFKAGRFSRKNYQCDNKEGQLEMLSQILDCIPNVEELYFASLCTNEIVKMVCSFKKLKKLYFLDCGDVTEDGIEYLCSQSENVNTLMNTLSVKPISLNENTIINILSKYPSLENFENPAVINALYNIHREDILNGSKDNIRGCNLTVLEPISPVYVDQPLHSEEMLQTFVKMLPAICPNLKKLSIVVFNDENLNCLTTFSRLESLNMESSRFNRPFISLKNIPNFNTLQHISFERFSISVANLLQSCSKLESLELNDISFEGDEENDNETKKYFAHLTELDLIDINFSRSNTDLSQLYILLKCCLKVASIRIHGGVFPEEDELLNKTIEHLASKKCLQRINISMTNIKPDFVTNLLLSCKSLQVVTIDECSDISHEDILNIYDVAKLNRVKIRYRIDTINDLRSTPESDFLNYMFDGDNEYDDYDDYDYYYNYDDYEDDSDEF